MQALDGFLHYEMHSLRGCAIIPSGIGSVKQTPAPEPISISSFGRQFMLTDFEYLIIGAGSMGSAAAYHLARDGQSVLLLEQFEIGHTRGSSHGESRII